MTILVTGSTGTVGTAVLAALAHSGAEIRALTRSPEKAKLPAGVTAVAGDPADPQAMRAALAGVSTLFLLVPGVADEITQVLNTLALAREAKVKGIVYLSVVRADAYTDVPHFAAKYAVERMIESFDLPATILRPSFFMQNDRALKGALTGAGLYPTPIGAKGVSMIDVGDIGAAAAAELLRRENAAGPLPRELYELSGPDALTGDAVAAIWGEVLGKPVRYAGDLDAFEGQMLKLGAPGWKAYEMRQMFRRYQDDGAVATAAEVERLTKLLGRAPRRYRDFAAETAKSWQE
jgi:uncharacterized protein YbjT (DUF2867 family)